jgi:WD40 repeat protein
MQNEAVTSLSISPDSGWLVTGHSDNAVHMWEIRMLPTFKRQVPTPLHLKQTQP